MTTFCFGVYIVNNSDFWLSESDNQHVNVQPNLDILTLFFDERFTKILLFFLEQLKRIYCLPGRICFYVDVCTRDVYRTLYIQCKLAYGA